MERNQNTTCRICLRFGSSVENNSKSLFEIHNSSLISNSIVLIANVKIQADDGLPNKICGECLTELDAAINFKDKCERSHKLLHSVNEGEEEEKLNSSPCAELPIPIELKKEDASEDDIQYEIEYYDEVESELESKPDVGQINTEIALEVKPELKAEESEATLNKCVSPVLKKSKAIDLKLECDDCGGSFKSKCKLRVHWKKVHKQEKLICNYCKRTFKSVIPYNKHLKNRPKICLFASETRIEGTGKSRIFHCKNCDYVTKTPDTLHLHLVTHKEERPYFCKLCCKGFKIKTILVNHNEMVHNIIKREITCQFCGEMVKGRHKIQAHLQKHMRTPVQCDICKKMFKTKHNLRNHLKLHSGIKAYTCDKCTAAFYTIAALNNHISYTHLKKKVTYECDICGYKPVKRDCLNRHKFNHTNSNVACSVCGRFYPDAKELASHQKVHTKEKSECLQCNRIFCDERSLKRHEASAAHKRKQSIFKGKVIKVKKRKEEEEGETLKLK